ncbi:hypothetical protein ACSTLJ_00335, partial [Vibrio parahaemolyticus]
GGGGGCFGCRWIKNQRGNTIKNTQKKNNTNKKNTGWNCGSCVGLNKKKKTQPTTKKKKRGGGDKKIKKKN